jgi:nucleoside-diphosphate-sugar epimerase
MTTRYEEVKAELRSQPLRWLVTGAARFFGSKLLERLLLLDQVVVVLDDLATGSPCDLEDVRSEERPRRWSRLYFIEGHPKVRQPDVTRARETLGWEPRLPLRNGLEVLIPYFREVLRREGIGTRTLQRAIPTV